MSVQFRGIHVFNNVSRNVDAAGELIGDVMAQEVLPFCVEDYENDQVVVLHGRDLEEFGRQIGGVKAEDSLIFKATPDDFGTDPQLADTAHRFIQTLSLMVGNLYPEVLSRRLQIFLRGLNGKDLQGKPIAKADFSEAGN